MWDTPQCQKSRPLSCNDARAVVQRHFAVRFGRANHINDVPLNSAGTVVVIAGELGGVVSIVAVTATSSVLPAASVAALLKLCTRHLKRGDERPGLSVDRGVSKQVVPS